MQPFSRDRSDNLFELRVNGDLAAGERDIADAISLLRATDDLAQQRSRKESCRGVIQIVLIPHAVAAMKIADIGQLDAHPRSSGGGVFGRQLG